ncbi:MAG: AGE family epimerase/isomerase, partial [Hyphomicrobiales bacterium]|nr:AGE family epimerase/isomerase [Hyphomicrobiales bacterium]
MVHRRHVEARLEDGGALGRWAASNALDWRERMWNGAVHAFEEDASHGPGFTLVVQAEALYAFARLAATAPDGSSPMIAVAKAASALTGRFLSPDGAPGFVSGVDANDRVLDATRGLDGHAVALKALAAAIAAGVVAARPAAEVTVDFLDDELATGSEGYRETAASALPRRQASHMRLLEATLALHAATGAPAHLARAHRLFDLFRFRFGAHEAVGLVETFDRDWAPLGAGRS